MAWELNGNANTNPNTNFLGTTDQEPVVIKTNGKEAVRVDPITVGAGEGTIDVVDDPDVGRAG